MTFVSATGNSPEQILNPTKTIADFPGSALKWIHIASPRFAKERLDINKYRIEVWEDEDSVTVILLNPGVSDIQRQSIRGSAGPLPEFSVSISKKDMKIISSGYER